MTSEFAKVEARLNLLRNRLNLLRLQHAVYLTATFVLLAVALLIVLALRATPSTFSYVLRGTVAAAGFGIIATAIVLRHRWISVDEVARIADRKANLEDRLATLLAHREARAKPSRLTGVLLAQLIELWTLWDPRQVIPSRVPRSLYLLLIALALLAVTAFVERRPSPATIFGKDDLGSGRVTLQPHPRSPSSDQQANPSPAGPRSSSPASATAPEQEHGTRMSDHPGSTAMGPGPEEPQESSDGDQAPEPSSAGNAGMEQSTGAGDPLYKGFQQAIREAFGADPPAPQYEPAEPDEKGQEIAGDKRGGANPGDRQTSRTGDEEQSPQPGGGRDNSLDSKTDDQQDGNEAESASGGPGAAAWGTGGTALLPESAPAAPGEDLALGSKRFEMRLSGASRAASSDISAQRQQGLDETPGNSNITANTDGQQIAAQLPQDAALHRAPIPAEHEATLQRIFSRELYDEGKVGEQ